MTPQSAPVRAAGPHFDTLAVGGGYTHADASDHLGAVSPPIFASAAEHFPSAAAMDAALAGEGDSWIYSRLGNPSVRYLERVVADLEAYETGQQASAAATASGMAAVALATSAFLSRAAGTAMNIVASSACYGATFMIFSKRYHSERGIEIRWVDDAQSLDEWASKIDENTRFVFCEVPANPTLELVDLSGLATVAHAHHVPLIVDSTLASPALLRPLGHGADVVVQSLGKSPGASGSNLGGAVIAKHQLVSWAIDDAGRRNFAQQLKAGPLRDMGANMSPFAAFTITNDIRELRHRVDVMSKSAHEIARALEASRHVAEVIYPGLPSHRGHALAKQMILVDSGLDGAQAHRGGFMLCFRPVGGIERARRVLDGLNLIWRANDVGRVKSAATIPAIATHRQVVESSGPGAVPPDLIRLSVGVEHTDDLMRDITKALEAGPTR